MYLKIVSGSDTHYIKCNEAVSVKRGADLGATCFIAQAQFAGSDEEFVTLVLEGVSQMNSMIATDGKVYLLDDSGRTVDVIKR
jgi:hypothetical protein